LLITLISFGQSVFVSGTITSQNSGEAILATPVFIKELDVFVVSDNNGHFEFENLKKGTYTFFVSSLGYASFEKKMDVTGNISNWNIVLEQQNLNLEKVEVVSVKGSCINSSSVINQQAIEHIQPNSVRDVLQLLPGSLAENPNLNKLNLLTIRSISTSNVANAMGTTLILDGATVMNDANMQVRSNFSAEGDNSTATSGVDARVLSAEDVESIEVIRGVPSAEYGNLTSGAVLVKSKIGYTPYEIRLKTDPKLKHIYAGKGFRSPKNTGIFNISAEYSNSQKELISPRNAYNRVNVNLGYSNTFARKFLFNAKITGYHSVSVLKDDPDILDFNQYQKDLQQRIGLNINGKWQIDKKWITLLEYSFSGNVTRQQNIVEQSITAQKVPFTTALSEGVFYGYVTENFYRSTLQIDGLPLDFQGKIVAKHIFSGKIVNNKVMLGVEFKSLGNLGKGKTFDTLRPPSLNASAAFLRERSYKELPFLNVFTAFAENKIAVKIYSTALEIQTGVRFNAILPNEKFVLKNLYSFEPRLNARYVVIDNKQFFSHLSFRAGWGINYKLPTMAYLFPEPVYYDHRLFRYNEGNTNINLFDVRMTVANANPDLKMPKSTNIEAGTDFAFWQIKGSVVFFKEKLTNAFSVSNGFFPYYRSTYGYNPDGSAIHYGTGQQFYYDYTSGNLYQQTPLGDVPVSKLNDTTFRSYSYASNNLTIDKWGIEYTLDFGTIEAIKTQVNVDGAYFVEKSGNYGIVGRYYQNSSLGDRFPYLAYYAGNTSSTWNATRQERANINLRLITHIPKVRMVATLTTQLVFYQTLQNISEYNGENLAYFYDNQGIKHSGEEVYSNTEYVKFVNPLYLEDFYGNIIPFTQEMENDNFFKQLVLRSNFKTSHTKQHYTPYVLLNLRLTKEIGKIATISFFANNFLALPGNQRNKSTNAIQEMNPSMYFGAEVKLRF
jgi:hypothetical protein